MKKFVIAKDKNTQRIVRIDEVEEGYSDGVCPDCGHNLIAANRNQATRKVACYFRHDRDSECSGESLVHLYAKQVLHDRKRVFVPDYTQTIFDPNDQSYLYQKLFQYSAKFISSDQAIMENSIMVDEKSRIPDVTFLGSPILHIEIHNTNKVDDDKKGFFKKLDQNCIEIHMDGYHAYLDKGESEFYEFVSKLANRQWIHFSSENKELRSAIWDSQQERKRKRCENENRKIVTHNKKEQWYKKNSLFIDRFRAFREHGIPLLREKQNAYSKYRDLDLEKKLKNSEGYFSSIISSELDHDYAFKCASYVWQWKIYSLLLNKFKESENDFFDEIYKNQSKLKFWGPEFFWNSYSTKLTVSECYRYLKDQGVIVLDLVNISESLNDGEALPLKRPKEKFLGLSLKEYELLPKPTIAIRKYLFHLCELGFLKYLHGNEFDILYREVALPYS
ncbi:MAG: hypothetical protein P1U57_01475 [Oleibacter sp.]|nr:hypothetical protein [Thalassolituus sp.]